MKCNQLKAEHSEIQSDMSLKASSKMLLSLQPRYIMCITPYLYISVEFFCIAVALLPVTLMLCETDEGL